MSTKIWPSENASGNGPKEKELGDTEPQQLSQLENNTTASNKAPSQGDPVYPSGLKLALIVIGLELAVLCIALDNTIITTAIPRISDQFHALSDVGWYGSAYLLTLSAFQLFFGRVYSIFNIKTVFLCSLFLFELGSLLCGVAPNSTAFIIGRAVAGLGSAGLFSGSMIVITFSTPTEKRPLYSSMLMAMYGIASAIGPLLGGVFTDRVTWRWCFYINLPLGGVTAVALIASFKAPPPVLQGSTTWLDSIARFDPIGTVLFMPCIVCLLLALQWGGTTYEWNNGRIIALFVVFGVLLIAFLAVQIWAGDNATLPLRIVKQRSIACGSLYSMCVGAAFFVIGYYIPIWFQAIRNASAMHSGINLLPLMLAMTISTLVTGIFVSTVGYYTPFMYGLVVVSSVGAGLLTTWTVDVSAGKWIGYQLLFGAGIGLGMQQSVIACQAVLPLSDIPIGTSIMMFAQMFGGSLFISIAQNTFTNHLVSGLSGIPGVNAAEVLHTGATEITGLIKDPDMLHTVQIVYNDAIMKAFLVGLIMICISSLGAAGMEWKSVKVKKSKVT
jgi:MFS family permease